MSAPIFRFRYELTSIGWAHAWLEDADRTTHLVASYLSDALGDLTGAIVALLDGARQAHFSWEEEPGEHLWLLTRCPLDTGEDGLRFVVLSDTAQIGWTAPTPWQFTVWAETNSPVTQEDDGRWIETVSGAGLVPVFTDLLPLRTFVGEVCRALDTLLANTGGAVGYSARWEGTDAGEITMPFPMADLERMRAWLATQGGATATPNEATMTASATRTTST